MTAFARCGPKVQTTTSPPFFSLSRSASSRAYPSDSLTSNERSPSSTHFPSRFTRRTASLFGTCFIKTTVFIISTGLTCLFFKPLEKQRGVCAAEAEAVRERVVNPCLARLVRDVVEVAVGGGVDVVGRWGQTPCGHREHGEDRLDAARSAEQVARHRLRGTDGELVCVFAESLLDGHRLELVV